MNRDKRVAVFARLTRDLASLSKCKDRQVAAVVTDKDFTQVYSIGVNGGPKDLMDCMCDIQGRYGCVHAEINALVKCNSADKSKVMFLSLSPCVSCAAAICNAPGGFSVVYYLEGWKNIAGINILNSAGIKCVKLTDY